MIIFTRRRLYNFIRTVFVLAAAVFSLSLTGCGSTSESDAVSDAMLAIGDRDFEGALETLTAANEAGESSRTLYRAMGIAKMGTGDYEGAAEDFEKALNKSSGIPDNMDYDINYYLATCYFKIGDTEEAKTIYDTILSLHPEDVTAYRLRATVLASTGDADGADADFRKAIELAPTDYDSIISAYETMNSYGFTEQGQQYLTEALENGGDISSFDKGRLYYYLQDYDNAKACLESAKTEEEGSYRTTLLLGKTYEALGSLDYAADTYESYIAGDGSSPEIYNQLGLCRLKLGNPEAALTAFQTGEKIEDNDILQSLKYNEIVAYEELGEFDKARILMETYRKLYPEDADAKREEIFLQTR